jgi:methylphosphotriester-DNA--protein-cysteine methyltransferase
MSTGTANSAASFSNVATERHYSLDELAALWNVSADTVRRLFERESGVLVIERARSRNARRYRTLRIPESVAERVHRRLSNPPVTRTI